jgi:hypothetical protein
LFPDLRGSAERDGASAVLTEAAARLRRLGRSLLGLGLARAAGEVNELVGLLEQLRGSFQGGSRCDLPTASIPPRAKAMGEKANASGETE